MPSSELVRRSTQHATRPEVPHAQVTRPPQRPQPIFRLRTWGFVRFVIGSVEESRGVWGVPPSRRRHHLPYCRSTPRVVFASAMLLTRGGIVRGNERPHGSSLLFLMCAFMNSYTADFANLGR